MSVLAAPASPVWPHRVPWVPLLSALQSQGLMVLLQTNPLHSATWLLDVEFPLPRLHFFSPTFRFNSVITSLSQSSLALGPRLLHPTLHLPKTSVPLLQAPTHLCTHTSCNFTCSSENMSLISLFSTKYASWVQGPFLLLFTGIYPELSTALETNK